MDNFYKNCPPRMEDARFLTDWRPSNVREQYIRNINGFVRTDEFRSFLQQNGDKIMDNEWRVLKEQNSCPIKTCIFNLPTRVPYGANHKDLEIYDNVKSGKISPNNINYPRCPVLSDYRMTYTHGK